jgi:Protein of unknown function (DUF445)
VHQADKRRRLRRSRLIALALLPLLAMLLLVSGCLKTVYPRFAGVQFSAEAALMGGVADWFAVVALFRHSLGLPPPYTAIVPRNIRTRARPIRGAELPYTRNNRAVTTRSQTISNMRFARTSRSGCAASPNASKPMRRGRSG